MVKVVLLANGSGSNPQTYRPNADESQWWNRRDALVRCVTAFFFCTTRNNNSRKKSSHNHSACSNKELIILFDEDWSYFSMKCTPTTTTTTTGSSNKRIPSESTIIHLWKYSAQNPGIRIRYNDLGLSCLCINSISLANTSEPNVTKDIESILLMNNKHGKSYSQTNTMMVKSDIAGGDSNNKRTLLEYLQTNCSMEFLRLHKLNSSIETLARKTNKTKLLEIKRIWDLDHENKKRKVSSISSTLSSDIATLMTSTSPPAVANDNNSPSLMSVIQHILQPESLDVEKVIAVTLHESSDNEFPCWDDDDNIDIRIDTVPAKPIQVCFFLGAVRDMYKNENRILRQICDQNHVPLLRVRFGPVSEFTSKILSVLAYHVSNHPRVKLGCERTIARNQRSINDATTESIVTVDPTLLHFICHVPISADAVTAALNNRTRLMWCLVRCTVTCLWRSKLAGGNNTASLHPPPTNRLSLLFNDGIVLTLNQNDLVVDMASNHQAAPSEYQVLASIRTKLDKLQEQFRDTKQGDRLHSSTLQHALFYDTNQNHWHCPTICIDLMIQKDPTKCDFYFYKPMDHQDRSKLKPSTKAKPLTQTIAICISLRSDMVSSINPDKMVEPGSIRSKIYQAIMDTCEISKKKESLIQISGHPLINLDDCVDEEGASITIIQHLAYQGRLIDLCHQIAKHDLQNINKKHESQSDDS